MPTGACDAAVMPSGPEMPIAGCSTDNWSALRSRSATTLGGMTADGSVVVATFADPTSLMTGHRHTYVHNAHGWFHLTTAAIGGVTALGAEAAAAVPARRAVFGGDDSSPDSSRASSTT